MINRKPESILPSESWDSLTSERLIEVADKIAWAAVLDAKFLCEVQRTAPYTGILCVFDLEKNRECVYSKEVGIMYDAVFGPDMVDVEMWQEDVVQFIDTKY